MSKTLTPAEFENGIRSEIASTAAAIEALNLSVTTAEKTLQAFVTAPTVAAFENAVRLQVEVTARRTLATTLKKSFNEGAEFQRLTNTVAGKGVLTAYLESKRPILSEIRSEITKARKKALQREEANDPEHYGLNDQANSLADTLESYENALKTASEHLARFPQALDGNCNYLAIRDRLDAIQN